MLDTTESKYLRLNPTCPLTGRYTVCEVMLGKVETSMTIQWASAPYDYVKSAAAVEKTLIALHGPRYGRPSRRFGPPTVLFSEPLALSRHKLDHLEPLILDRR